MRLYMRLHFSLTSQLCEAAHNIYAAEFYATLQTLARRFLYFHQARHSDLTRICDLHIEQINTIVDGDVERAITASIARNDYAEQLAQNILMELIITSAVTVSPANRS